MQFLKQRANYLLPLGLIACLGLMSLVVKTNGDLSVGTEVTAIYNDAVGRFGQALNWDFNPNNTQKGLIFEYGTGESGGFYADSDYAVIWSPGDNNRLLRIYDEDNMGTGSTNYEMAYIDGTGAYFKASDKRRKKDISKVTNSMDKLSKIDGVNYKFITSNAQNNKVLDEKVAAGFLAQDIEKVMPEIVATDEHGNKFVNYEGMMPYIVEALKAQKLTIDSLKTEIKKLKK